MPDSNNTTPSITIYTAPWCGYCKLAKEYFASKNLSYTEHDVEQDPDMAREAMEKSGQLGVPIIIIDNQIIVGFDQARIESILDNDSKPGGSAAHSNQIDHAPIAMSKLPEVVMYTTAWCSACRLAKEFFKSHQINWTEKNAEVPEIGREMIEKSGQLGVPVIYVGNELVVGFDESRLRSIIGQYAPAT